jgi:purine-nucleoside phosphorylase
VSANTPSDQDRLLDETAEVIRRVGGGVPRPLVVVAGSGQMGLAGALTVEHRLPPDALPHLPRPGVLGHGAGVLLGRVGRLNAIFFLGRVHLYEGWPPHSVTFAVQMASRLGGKFLFINNAAGGINGRFQAGDLMMIRDQINLTFRPLLSSVTGFPSGPNERKFLQVRSTGFSLRSFGQTQAGACTPNPSPLYDARLCGFLREAARLEKIHLKEGVYAGNLGPTYETRSESAMLAALGADAVGMSTVAEVAAARSAGLRVVGVSCIANKVPMWGQSAVVTHGEVIERVSRALERLKRLIVRWSGLVADDANR